MNIDSALADTRTSQAVIGLPKAAFDSLLPLFEEAIAIIAQEKKSNAGHPYKLKNSEGETILCSVLLEELPNL